MEKKNVSKKIYFIMEGDSNKIKYVNFTVNNLVDRLDLHKSSGSYLQSGDVVLYQEFNELEYDEIKDLTLHIIDSLGLDYSHFLAEEDMEYDGSIVDKFKNLKLEECVWEGDK